MKIVKAHQTCYACPSQWDAWDEEGNYWYLRFRHGYGTAEDCGGTAQFFFDADSNGLDGVIDLQNFCNRAGIELAPDVVETSVYDYWPYTDVKEGS